MSYTRKTRDEYELQGDYGQGWECLTTEDTRSEARARLREYAANEGGSYRIKARRVRIAQEA